MMMLGPCHNNHCGQPSDGMKNPENCEESLVCVSRCTAYGNVCPCSARAAGQAARKKMESIICNSQVFAEGKPQFRSVDGSEIIMGEKLGEGGFSMVHSCSLKDAPLDESCAIKYLKRRVMVEQRCFEHGAADLATEAFFLARLDHPNIVKLHAVTAGSVESNISIGKDVSFFIVLDRLVETLEQRIDRWRSKAEKIPNSLFYRMSKDYKETQKAMLKERLQIALEIATVMEYLHNLNILLRDLKPDNIGFDQKGTLKLFDFGLAKEEKAADALEDGKYKMTGHTGSRRYMAPEVATNKPYDKSVDIFSFGILLWEMCALEKPFQGCSSKKHMKDVILGGDRPKMDSSHTAHWPVDLQWLIKSSWSESPETRPSFTTVKETLECVLKELSESKPDNPRARSMGNEENHGKQHRHWHLGLIRHKS